MTFTIPNELLTGLILFALGVFAETARRLFRRVYRIEIVLASIQQQMELRWGIKLKRNHNENDTDD